MKFRYLILSAMAVLAISCGKEEYTLSGTGEKTPLEIAVSIKDGYGSARTKAYDSTFETNDKLLAFVEQVLRTGTDQNYSYTFQLGEKVDFTVEAVKDDGSVASANLDKKLYWDDFSNTEKDITKDDRFLRVGYGFCFNGVDKSTTFDDTHTTVEWTVESEQDVAGNFKKSDLLWAGVQPVVHYDHDRVRPDVQDKVTLPVTYTHAMSKVTVDVVLSDGFTADASGNVFAGSNDPVKLFANTSSTEVNAKAQTITTTVSDASSFIKMKMVSDEVVTAGVSNKTRVYEAIIAPTVMKGGNKLLEITVGGNTYHINLTDAILNTVYPAASNNATWASHLKAYTITTGKLSKDSPETDYNATLGGITLPGVNYKLVVNLKKQQIEVSASVVDWDNVTAGAEGEIKFDSDVTTTGVIADALKTDGFDVYKNSVNTAFETKTTTVTWDGTESKWLYTPVIYWAGQSDYSYFRALYPKGSTTEMSQGSDILWGYACDDVTANGSKVGSPDEVKINPRTGDVPLTFEHAMSKISVVLKTSTGDDKVDLTDAKISIINLYDGGTLNLVNGNTETLVTKTAEPFTIKDATQISGQVVIPQSLTKLAGGSERGDTPTFYQTSELTKIYGDNTSLPAGGGDGTYYLTSTLDQVKYTEAELTDIYSNGTSISDGSTFETYVTATLTHVDAQAAVKYTQTECDDINNPHRIADDHNRAPGDPEYVTTYPADYTPITTETIKTPAVPEHYEVNSNSVKATTSTLKCYKKTSSSEPHTPGELKAKGNKIMMYVTLKNGSRYSIEMSKCITSDSNLITEWKRGEHYTYEITLGKEQITFRALIKQWDEKAGSGSATLDWD